MWFQRRGDRSGEADVIWNRATELELASDALTGDVALWHAVQLDGLVANGGLAHGIEVLGRGAVERAAAGWGYLGRGDVANLLHDALAVLHDMPDDADERDQYFVDGWTEEQAELLEELNWRYDDDAVEVAFQERLRTHPEDFAPTQ